MTKELDEKLCKDFPTVFRDRHEDPTQTAMCWGFECGDGWEPLIRKACKAIEAFNQTVLPDARVVATQIKEKFGTLRFYVNYYYDAIEPALKEAEKKSAKTCEECGKPGKLRGKFWVYTACRKHTKEGDK